MEDERFAHIGKDPKFRRIPKEQTKIKIDKRFQSMFKDKKFQVKYTTDKRGRPVSHSSKEDLKRYYHISSEESENSESDSVESDENSQNGEAGKFVRAPKPESTELLKVSVKNDKNITDVIKKKLRNLNVDYARGECAFLSETSSDDEESDDEISETEDLDHKWGELDADAETTDEITHRLAACNMDWDRIRAVDLMVLFNSFLPSGGVIKSIVIHPSEFGKQRMQEEELKGPIELVSKSDVPTKVDENEEHEEGSKYHMEKLRQYQLNRLKYYYAVITFDSPSSANKIYRECDGMEYESTATKIDLRFIPNDVSFDNDEVKEKCEKLPELNKYQPRFFTTTALQQAKVDLTWDETDPDRVEIAEKINTGKLDEISVKDLQSYLAGSSSEEEVDKPEDKEEDNDNSQDRDTEERNVCDKYKLLLQELQNNEEAKKNKDVEMEITWGINLKEKTEQMVQKKMSDSKEKTPFQKYLDKRKEKRKEKRQANKKNTDNEADDVPSDIDMNDPYFAEEFDSSEFIPLKKKKDKKLKKKDEDDSDRESTAIQQKELELLLEDDDGKKHFSLKKIQDEESKSVGNKKGKNNKNIVGEKQDDDFKINVQDDRFSALFTSHHYNLDPTDPHFKKTKNMETLIKEKLKRRDERGVGEDGKNKVKRAKIDVDDGNKKKDSSELSLLVKSVKRKAGGFKSK